MKIEKKQISRRSYLIKGGAVVTVDPTLGTFPTQTCWSVTAPLWQLDQS
jgi:hypothetical protein